MPRVAEIELISLRIYQATREKVTKKIGNWKNMHELELGTTLGAGRRSGAHASRPPAPPSPRR